MFWQWHAYELDIIIVSWSWCWIWHLRRSIVYCVTTRIQLLLYNKLYTFLTTRTKLQSTYLPILKFNFPYIWFNLIKFVNIWEQLSTFPTYFSNLYSSRGTWSWRLLLIQLYYWPEKRLTKLNWLCSQCIETYTENKVDKVYWKRLHSCIR